MDVTFDVHCSIVIEIFSGIFRFLLNFCITNLVKLHNTAV